MKQCILIAIVLSIIYKFGLAVDVRLVDLDPPEAQQQIESHDTTLHYAPKVDSNVPATRVLGNEPTQVLEDIYLANQYHGQDGLGGYLYGYSVPDIAKTERKHAGGDLKGAYNYISGDGQEIKVEYWDDGTGFHQTDNVPLIQPQQIPDTPEVQAAKEEHARIWAEQAERNSHPIADPNANYRPGQTNYNQPQQNNYLGQGTQNSASYQPSPNQFGQGQQKTNQLQSGGNPQRHSNPGQPILPYGGGQQIYGGGAPQQGAAGQQHTGGNVPHQGAAGQQYSGQGAPSQQQYGKQQPQGSGISQHGAPNQQQYGGQQAHGGSASQQGAAGQQHTGGNVPHQGAAGQQYNGQGAPSQQQYGKQQPQGGGISQDGASNQQQYGEQQAHGGGASQQGAAGQQYSGQHTGGHVPQQGGQQPYSGQHPQSGITHQGPTAQQQGGGGQQQYGGQQQQHGSAGQNYGGPQQHGGTGTQGVAGQQQYGSTSSPQAVSGQKHGQQQYGGSAAAPGQNYGGYQAGRQPGSAGQQHAGTGQAQQYGGQQSVQYTGQQSEIKSTYASSSHGGHEDNSGDGEYKPNPNEDNGEYRGGSEEEQGPPKGFWYNYDYPVGIIVSKQGGAAPGGHQQQPYKRSASLGALYEENKKIFESQLKAGSSRSAGGSYQVHA